MYLCITFLTCFLSHYRKEPITVSFFLVRLVNIVHYMSIVSNVLVSSHPMFDGLTESSIVVL